MSNLRELERPTVLVVEDDDELRCAMATCLARAGFAVTLVSTGADAVRAARGRRPEAMVIDLVLPDSGGLGVAEVLRLEPELASVPVLFTTGLDSPAVQELIAPAPVLYKPFKQRQLVGWVRRATSPAPRAEGAGVEAP